MIAFIRSQSSRYLVAEQTVSADSSNVFHIYCDNIADVHAALTRNWGRWQRTGGEFVHLTISNGYKPGDVPAAMIKHQCQRSGRFTAAVGNLSGVKAELVVIAL